MYKCRNIQYGIIYILLDGEKHTIAEMAERLEVCYRTVSRHLIDIALYFPINSFVGGKSGGVQLDKKFFSRLIFFTFNDMIEVENVCKYAIKFGYAGEPLLKKVCTIISRLKPPYADTAAKPSERSMENERVM